MAGRKKIDLSTVVVRSKDVLVSEIDNEVVMMSIENGSYSGLDSIGSEIWELLETPRRVSEVCDVLMERYDVDRPRCEKDVLVFLDDLASDETIKVIDADR